MPVASSVPSARPSSCPDSISILPEAATPDAPCPLTRRRSGRTIAQSEVERLWLSQSWHSASLRLLISPVLTQVTACADPRRRHAAYPWGRGAASDPAPLQHRERR